MDAVLFLFFASLSVSFATFDMAKSNDCSVKAYSATHTVVAAHQVAKKITLVLQCEPTPVCVFLAATTQLSEPTVQ